MSGALVHLFTQPDLGQRLELAICQDLQGELDEGKSGFPSDGMGAIPVSATLA
jgi:hypothetical protein